MLLSQKLDNTLQDLNEKIDQEVTDVRLVFGGHRRQVSLWRS